MANSIILCFFTDGKYVAFGSRDNSIYVYNVDDVSLVGECPTTVLTLQTNSRISNIILAKSAFLFL